MEMEMEEIMQEGECSYNKGVATDVDDAVEHGKEVVLDVDSMVDFMEKKLGYTRGKPSYRSATIFTIPYGILYSGGFDDAAYRPKVVSIGLLHQQEGLRLDKHKWHYLDKVLSRSKNNLKMYTKEMADIVVEAAFCYSGCLRSPEPGMHDLKPPETEDVHHLLHLIHLSLQPASSSENPESTSGTTIPGSPQPDDTLSSTKNYSFESPKPLQPASPTEKPESASGAPIPSPPQPSDTLSTSKSSPFKSIESLQPTSPSQIRIPCFVQTREPFAPPSPPRGMCFESLLQPHDGFQIRSGLLQIPSGLGSIPRAQQIIQMSEPRPAPPPKTIPSATELQEAGVELQRRRARSFLDVTFEQGLMQIPRLTISDSTNSLFRNFIAFEQGFPDCGNHFTSYCIFMDSLINTPRDVEILKQSGIIEHVLGSDEEVALLFNKLSRGITWDFKNSYLAKVFEDVNQHSQKRWPKWRAKLVRDYFSNPWAILSLIAAIVILILTFLQTYFGVFAYFRPP